MPLILLFCTRVGLLWMIQLWILGDQCANQNATTSFTRITIQTVRCIARLGWIALRAAEPVTDDDSSLSATCINTEMVTKIVAVRAVNMPIGAFCKEFQCECSCDDDFFLSLPQPIGRPEVGNRVCHNLSADRLHQPNSSRLADRSQPIGAD